MGPLHWAGAETSHIGEAHMDGAVRAGQRAADEVLGTFATKARA
ncbi:FAD-dependent oxidoreductase [Lentzea jiangxiensis]